MMRALQGHRHDICWILLPCYYRLTNQPMSWRVMVAGNGLVIQTPDLPFTLWLAAYQQWSFCILRILNCVYSIPSSRLNCTVLPAAVTCIANWFCRKKINVLLHFLTPYQGGQHAFSFTFVSLLSSLLICAPGGLLGVSWGSQSTPKVLPSQDPQICSDAVNYTS